MSLKSATVAALDPVVTFERAFGMPAHPWQRRFLREHRPAVILKSRQIGATTAAAALAIHEVVYRRDTSVVIVSPTLKQSGEIVVRARAGLRELGERLIADSASMLRLRNGSRIVSLPGTAKSVRGYVASLLILDEAAFIEDETWIAARALVATGGRLVVQSTPWDAQGPFFDLVDSGDPAWARFTVPATDVASISEAFLDGQRAALTPEAFAREYECTFTAVGATLFPLERLQSLVLTEVPA